MTRLENESSHVERPSSPFVNDLDLTPRGRRERCDCACIPKPPKFTPVFGRFSFGYPNEVPNHTTAGEPSVTTETQHRPVHEIVLDQQEPHQGEIKLDGTCLPELYDSSEEGEEGSDCVAHLNSDGSQRGGRMPLHQSFFLQFWQMLISIVLWHKWNGIRSSNTKLIAESAHNVNDNHEVQETVSDEVAAKD